ncbi:AAA family ATPase [Streptomyces profundus]|uniref:AAA family ATPase n=1 Tax=Streptomyces profundus TaxID=2867410 RepID=UPI001D1604E7|nr:LuxR family transcriptional regulator [Streptomyces sp. MA3_2.13]UED88051.1 AAA family ATPase [Streptomyces sp. MA3_2.13]
MTHLVERDQELAALTDMVLRGAGGEGQAALVVSGIGCGKTALLAELGELAREFDFRVLTAFGSLAERRTPGAVLGQLLRDVPHDPADLAALTAGGEDMAARSGGTVTRLGPSALDPEESRALQRICSAVTEQARRTPLVLCVDDVQFMDELSLHGVLLLLRRLPTVPLTLVLTECTLSRPADPRLHAELRRLPGHQPLTLGRLTADGVAALLTTRLGGEQARLLAPECHALSAGNPLLVHALAEDSRHTADGPAPRLEPGEAFLDAATGCLHRGWPALLSIAQALAVLHEDNPAPPTVARLAKVEEGVLERGLRALDNAGLLAEGRPRHAAVRIGALAGCTGQELAVLHRRAAELLYEEGAPPTGVARHLVAAGPLNAPWAVSQLREAAERHLAAGHPARARPCLDTALLYCRDEDERLRLKALLASAAWALDPRMGARHLVELADALRDGRLPAQHAVMLAKYLLWHGRYDEAADAIERITRADGVLADPLAAAEARATRELLSVTYPGLVPHGGVDAGPTRHTAFAGDPRSRGAAALSDVLRHGPAQEPVAAAEAAMRVMRLGKNTHEWLTCAVSALLFADRTTAAAQWCDHWLAEAHSRRVPLWIAEFSSLRAGIALRQGRPLDARRLAKAALTQVPVESWGVCIGGPLANLIQAATDLGDREAGAEYLEVPLPDGLFSSRFGLYYLHARGTHFLADGQPEAALDDFTDCGALMREWGLDQPALIPWRSGAARAHLALGSTGRAHALAREQLALAGEAFTRTRGISLRVLAATSRPVQRGALLRSALAVLEESGDRLQLAGTLTELATADLRSGRFSSSDALLARAAKLAEECGSPRPGVVGRAAAGSRSPAAPTSAVSRPGPGGVGTAVREEAVRLLSPAERRVVGLASAGLSNREISGRLNVTVSTVEQHLTRIFRKLGVRARGDLPRAAGE